ncbi:MAG: PSD1 and planctomycete cytochrome C domain-containing protein [Pirellulaceae bacterium]
MKAELLAILSIAITSPLVAQDRIDFNRQIRPILSENCFQCHGPDANARQADLRLDLADGISGSGDTPIIVAGKPGKSELIARITSKDPDLVMPPTDSNRDLSDNDKRLLEQWVKEGAEFSKHWSLITPSEPEVPTVKRDRWSRNNLDRFILRRIREHGLTESDSADKETLIRRVTLDLTGLPPTLEEIDTFLADASARAYENLVTRLMNSVRYGEHMAWNWLEASRYSDTNGYQGDRTRTMHYWRDWVVRSFNNNQPYDTFVVDQLAGDLLEKPTDDQLVATGFNRNHPLNGEGGRIAEENRVEYVFDRTETTSTVFMGLTVGCARCHDHKYDPITQREYYQLYAYFNSIAESGRVDAGGNANPVAKVPSYEQQQRILELNKENNSLHMQRAEPFELLAEARTVWMDTIGEQVKTSGRADGWQVQIPAAASSSDGATMHIEPLGKVVVSGTFPKHDDYTVTIPHSAGIISAIRLEALTSEALGFQGPGRKANFNLTSFEVGLKVGDGKSVPVKLARAISDHHESDFTISNTLDPAAETGWGVFVDEIQTAQDRTGIYYLDQPLTVPENASLVITMRHRFRFEQHLIGTFRISTSNSEAVNLDTPTAPPQPILDVLVTPVQDWNKEQRELVFKYHRQKSPQYRAATRQLRFNLCELERMQGKFADTMVMRDLDNPRETHILTLGKYDAPQRDNGLISHGVPSSLTPLPEDASPDRLSLANWLVTPSHPLTARVAVNRIWQQLFGVGLVESPEDFGAQGKQPSHPELLDWLAIDFQESGWDNKRLVRQIVTSATYRQSALVTNEAQESDPQNIWLSRAPRYRLPAHVIRDQALYLSGLLVEKLGGPSVKPYQPPGLWADFSFGKIKYTQDSGESLYRRSLYTFWRRSLGPPNMFDEADRKLCSVRMRRTNTPLHALTLLNDITYIEAARVFAESLLQTDMDDQQRLAKAFRMMTGRHATDVEKEILANSLQIAKEHYGSNIEAASQLLETGDRAPAEGLDAVEVASLASVLNVVMNADEVISKE